MSSTETRAPADRLPVSQRIMLKLENRPVRRKVQVEIKKHTKANKDQPVVMTNPKYWMRPDLIAARG